MQKSSKTIAILGATGSVGRQAVSVAKSQGYKVDFLTAGSNVEELVRLCRLVSPRAVAIADKTSVDRLKEALNDTDINVLCGEEGIIEGISQSSADTVINAILGKAGVMPTLATIRAGKRLALANKESLVIAGDIVINSAKEAKVDIIPVDSEPSAIFQSLHAGRRSEIKRIILTASGGPFYGKSKEELDKVTLEDALKHPTWKMGKKITVDSATLMNKGFELIEAVHLFGVRHDNIDIVIHRESILHSAVEYIDNAIIGEFSVPDMRACVQYAVDYPYRRPASVEQLDLIKLGKLTFSEPDYNAFPLLSLARAAISDGGAMPAVLNAADEVAVAAFLGGKNAFKDIYSIVSKTYERLDFSKNKKSLDDIMSADAEARLVAKSFI